MKRLLALFLIIVPALCFGQAFGFEDAGEDDSSFPFTLDIGGKVEAALTVFFHDFEKNDEYVSIPDFVNARVNFDINGRYVQFFTSLNLSSRSFEEFANGDFKWEYSPVFFDELWLRGYFDKLSVQAGFIKLRWGRMYSPGPLDIGNPLDYSDLTKLTESRDMKIARPMVHASYKLGEFSGIEAVFMPNFAPHRFAQDGRWVPYEFANVTSVFAQGVLERALQILPSAYHAAILALFAGMSDDFSSDYSLPDTSTPDYFQAGLRFNTVIGSGDLGFQYFYGNYMRPNVSLNGVDDFIGNLVSQLPSPVPDFGLLSPHIEYTRFHQIGVDYSQVLAGFTLRAEFAAHITGDLSGDDGNVKNPFLAWSLGFDRDIFAGVNINVQCNETIRLFDDRVGDNPAMDGEAGTNAVSTRLIVQISKNFFRDRLECKVVNIWDIEDSGVVVIPSVAWTINDTRIELSAGIFAGEETSELGQYRDNSYIKLRLIYSF